MAKVYWGGVDEEEWFNLFLAEGLKRAPLSVDIEEVAIWARSMARMADQLALDDEPLREE